MKGLSGAAEEGGGGAAGAVAPPPKKNLKRGASRFGGGMNVWSGQPTI